MAATRCCWLAPTHTGTVYHLDEASSHPSTDLNPRHQYRFTTTIFHTCCVCADRWLLVQPSTWSAQVRVRGSAAAALGSAPGRLISSSHLLRVRRSHACSLEQLPQRGRRCEDTHAVLVCDVEPAELRRLGDVPSRGSGGGSSTGTSASGRSSGSGSTSPTLIERDPDALWTPGAAAFATASAARMSAPDVQSASGSRSIWGRRRAAAAAAAASAASASAAVLLPPPPAAAGDVAKSAELSRLNIAHKNSMGIFTTAPALWQLLQAAGVAPPDPEQVAAADQAARRTTKRGRR